MKFEYHITTGHYNWANEREKTVYIRIVIVNEKEEKFGIPLTLFPDDCEIYEGKEVMVIFEKLEDNKLRLLGVKDIK